MSATEPRDAAAIAAAPGSGGKTRSLKEDLLALMPSLLAYAQSLSRDAADAEDLVQETMLKAIGNIHQFKRGTNLRAWMFTILRNSFYTRYHKRRREPAMDVSKLPEAVEKPSQHWALKLRLVDDALGELAVEQREALILVGGAGLSYEEAAIICGCAIGTVKSRVSRARRRLILVLGYDSEADLLNENS